jgi:hypothetical protein
MLNKVESAAVRLSVLSWFVTSHMNIDQIFEIASPCWVQRNARNGHSVNRMPVERPRSRTNSSPRRYLAAITCAVPQLTRVHG